MGTIDNIYGGFSEQLDATGGKGLIVVLPEMAPAIVGISPTGRYNIYYVDPESGSSTFIVEQDTNGDWFCECCPNYISALFVMWIGERIERSVNLP